MSISELRAAGGRCRERAQAKCWRSAVRGCAGEPATADVSAREVLNPLRFYGLAPGKCVHCCPAARAEVCAQLRPLDRARSRDAGEMGSRAWSTGPGGVRGVGSSGDPKGMRVIRIPHFERPGPFLAHFASEGRSAEPRLKHARSILARTGITSVLARIA